MAAFQSSSSTYCAHNFPPFSLESRTSSGLMQDILLTVRCSRAFDDFMRSYFISIFAARMLLLFVFLDASCRFPCRKLASTDLKISRAFVRLSYVVYDPADY